MKKLIKNLNYLVAAEVGEKEGVEGEKIAAEPSYPYYRTICLKRRDLNILMTDPLILPSCEQTGSR